MSTSPPVNKLRAAMQGMAGVADVPQPLPPVPAGSAGRKSPIIPSRQGRRNVSAYIEATAAKQLRLLAVERDTSTQALIEEALNDLFRKHGKSAIA